MKIIFAQGNPGAEYEKTRHNVGWRVLDTFETSFVEKSKFHAAVAEISISGEKVLLVKPTTFYNETGSSLRAVVDFYKLTPATDILVLHDELALPLGTLRVRPSGRDAGNNGIKSLNTHIGESYHRIRIGVATEQRGVISDTDFVLGRFSQLEEDKLKTDIVPHCVSLIEDFVLGRLDHTSHTL